MEKVGYIRAACNALGLIYPEDAKDRRDSLLTLGTFQIIYSDAALDAVVGRYLYRLRRGYQRMLESEGLSAKERNAFAQGVSQRAVFEYSDFVRFNGRGDTETNRTGPIDTLNARHTQGFVRYSARERFARDETQTGGYAPDRSGYRLYLWRHTEVEFWQLLDEQITAIVPDAARREHSYILATTGVGKSELMKAICLNYVQRQNAPGVVLLDPGGGMAEQIARWPELIPSGRLVFIDPMLDPMHVPVINPFDGETLPEEERTVLASEIVGALGTLIEGKIGGDLSVNMEALLYPCIRLLVALPNTSIDDLRRLMRDDAALVAEGKRSQISAVSDFFENDFNLPTFKSTKQSVLVKLNNILSRGTLERVLCGKSTIDLERLVNERKIILVNLDKGRLGDDESSALGTLLVSLITAIAKRRSRMPEAKRPMTHLIVDECQNFLTSRIKTIIRETRKFRLAVTLAQQELGGEMDTDLKNVVVKTTNVKIVGRSARDETRATGALVGVDAEDIATLPVGMFYYSSSNRAPVLLAVRDDRVGGKGGVDAAMWERVKQQQLHHFYRRVGMPTIRDDRPRTEQPTAKEETKRARREKAPPEPEKKRGRYRFE